MPIEHITLRNILSFGPDTPPLALRPLNVVIGPNGSGKSNLLEAIDLLRHVPSDLSQGIRQAGGIQDWLWKGAEETPIASIEAVVTRSNGSKNLRYTLSFTEVAQRLQIQDERIANESPDEGYNDPYFYYKFQNGRPVLNLMHGQRQLRREDIDIDQSIVAQRRDPEQYPEITYLADVFSKMRLYRDWTFGRRAAPRLPQKTDLPADVLNPDATNLALVLNRLRRNGLIKARILDRIQRLYDGIDDYDVQIEGGTVQVFFLERGVPIPATRLSDGTLRYLCLVAILCDPAPPPLICIEEPELGLHPDIIPTIAALLREAGERTQIIVTTHSDILVDAMTDTPEAVLVCEKHDGATGFRRLQSAEIAPWLNNYRLGDLWTRGEIGGTRW
jgi:predicted ATPase